MEYAGKAINHPVNLSVEDYSRMQSRKVQLCLWQIKFSGGTVRNQEIINEVCLAVRDLNKANETMTAKSDVLVNRRHDASGNVVDID